MSRPFESTKLIVDSLKEFLKKLNSNDEIKQKINDISKNSQISFQYNEDEKTTKYFKIDISEGEYGIIEVSNNDGSEESTSYNNEDELIAAIISSLDPTKLELSSLYIGTNVKSLIKTSGRIDKSSLQKPAQAAAVDIEKNPQDEYKKAAKLTRFLLLQALQKEGSLSAQEREQLRNRLKELVSNNQENNQEDAADMFLRPLLNFIYPDEKQLPLNYVTTIAAPSNNNVNVHGANMMELPLASGDNISVADLILLEEKEEILEEGNWLKRSDGIPEKTILHRNYCYNEEADEIFVVLKRYNFNRDLMQYQKLTNSVDLNNITLTSATNPTQTQEYVPTACIMHRGGDGFGHYIAYIKDRESEELWRQYNDGEVSDFLSLISTDEGFEFVQKEMNQAYIIKYTKAGLELPSPQISGTPNSDNECWGNASLALILSCNHLRKKLEAEFAQQNFNFEKEIAELDSRIAQKEGRRIEEQRIREFQFQQMQQFALWQQRAHEAAKQIMEESANDDEIDEDLITLVPSLENVQRLYQTDSRSSFRFQGDGETIFDSFSNFCSIFDGQLEIELEHPNNVTLINANNSFFINIFPIANNNVPAKEIRTIGKYKESKDKFDQLIDSVIQFYGLGMHNVGEKPTVYCDADETMDWQRVDNHNQIRFSLMIKSAIYLGFIEYAKAIYEFLQREVDIKKTIEINNDIRKDWSIVIPELFKENNCEIFAIKTVDELKEENRAKRRRISDDAKKQSGKTTTEFSSKHIYEFPQNRESIENKELTVGDLHGNALKLLWILTYHDLIEIDKKDYEEFANIYKKVNLEKKDVEDINKIIEKIKVKDKNVFLRLIGDVLCDRGNNDYITILLLGKINDESLQSEILFSNHDEYFVRSLYVYLNQFKQERAQEGRKHGEDFANCLEHDLNSYDVENDVEVDMGQSMTNLEKLLSNGIIDEENFQKFYAILQNQYLTQLKLVSYNLADDGSIAIFTHAPCGLQVIEAAAKKLVVEFKKETAQELAESIDRINACFAKYVKGEVLDENGNVISVFDLVREKGDTSEIPDYSYASGGDFISKKWQENPFTFLIWTRLRNYQNDVYAIQEKPYKISYSFGHTHNGSVIPNDESNKPEHHERLSEFLCNLDNSFGKGSKDEFYTYRLDENKRKKNKDPNSMATPKKVKQMEIEDTQPQIV